MFRRKINFLLALIFALCLGSTSAFGAGYAILEQSGEGVGNAFAGAAAGYGDGSEVSFNPAAMAWIDGTLVSHTSHLIVPSAEFSNQGSATSSGMPLVGDNGPDGGETAYVPNVYVVHQLNEKVNLGLGINAPFGLATEYDSTYVGRYHGITSDLMTLNINPAVSVKLDDHFAIGGGLNILYADAELTNAVDFGTIGVATLGLPTASAMGLLPQSADGMGSLNGDDWGLGFNLGVSYNYGNDSRFGLAWHSKIDTTLTGTADFDVPTAALPLTATGAFTDTSGSADLTLPDYASASIIHNFNNEWSLLGEVQWTHWSRFEELRVGFGNGQADSVVDEGWDNSWRFSAAANYRPVDKLTLRGGFAYDQTPISDAQHRTPRIPGNDRKWAAFGIGYEFSDGFEAGLNYAHLFISDSSSDIRDAVGNNFLGDWEHSTDIVSLNVNWNFS